MVFKRIVLEEYVINNRMKTIKRKSKKLYISNILLTCKFNREKKGKYQIYIILVIFAKLHSKKRKQNRQIVFIACMKWQRMNIIEN